MRCQNRPAMADNAHMDALAAAIERHLADSFSAWEIRLPKDAVARRQGGHLFEAGWHIGWVFGEAEGEEYVEVLTEHRHPGMDRFRIYASGRTESLDVPTSLMLYPQDERERKRIEREFFERNRRLYAELRQRGLLPPGGENLASQEISEHLSTSPDEPSRGASAGDSTSVPEEHPGTDTVAAMDEFALHLKAAGLEETEDGQWRQGDEVGVVLTSGGAFIGWRDVAWTRPSTPEWQLQDVLHLPLGQVRQLSGALARARARREAARRSCRYCGERFSPGHMHSEDVCQGCAERHLGVVH
jgi:hypothetical protein